MDKMWMKIYVSSVWVLDTLYQIIVLAFTYVYLVQDIGNPVALAKITS